MVAMAQVPGCERASASSARRAAGLCTILDGFARASSQERLTQRRKGAKEDAKSCLGGFLSAFAALRESSFYLPASGAIADVFWNWPVIPGPAAALSVAARSAPRP